MKKVIKEIAIFLLLSLVTFLILAILLYDYNPASKVIPSKVSYVVPESIKEDLQEANTQASSNIQIQDKVYTIEGTDLNVYKKNNTYDSGKVNPFETVSRDAEETDQSTEPDSSGTSSPAAMSSNQINSNIQNGSSGTTPTRLK